MNNLKTCPSGVHPLLWHYHQQAFDRSIKFGWRRYLKVAEFLQKSGEINLQSHPQPGSLIQVTITGLPQGFFAEEDFWAEEGGNRG